MSQQSRLHPLKLLALVEATSEGEVKLFAPKVGVLRGAPQPGQLVYPGSSLGELEILGQLYQLVAPDGASGVVQGEPTRITLAKRPLAYRELIAQLRPAGSSESFLGQTAATAQTQQLGLVFAAPTSGRFYVRPSPEEAPFIQVGEELQTGATVCLLEVMKTFNRIAYAGDGLPKRARITQIFPEDGADVEAGDPLFALEPLGA